MRVQVREEWAWCVKLAAGNRRGSRGPAGHWLDGFDKSVWGSMIQAVMDDLQKEERRNE